MYGNWNVELIQTSPNYQVVKGAAMVTGGTITIHLESVPGDQIIQYNIDIFNKKIISLSNQTYPIQEMSDNKIVFTDSENNTTVTLTR